jgi:hypothetical protein
MPHLAEGIELVLLCETTTAMIDEAVTAVADAHPHPEKLRDSFYERRSAMTTGELPEALWLLRAGSRFVGWVGWAPYKEKSYCWQTTTYFASELRGTGLFERARCHQLHAADIVAAWAIEAGLPQATFMLSIADWNARSIRASRHYAASNGWPDTWEQVFEPIAERHAHVFTFPYPNATHQCYLPGRSFEEYETLIR